MRREALKGSGGTRALCPLVWSVPAPAVSSVTTTASSPIRATSFPLPELGWKRYDE
jgi:hypothetical protein